MELILIVSSFSCSIGIIIGSIITYVIHKDAIKRQPYGILRIDQSDIDGPFLFLELNKSTGVEKIMKNDKVLFNVLVENYGTPK